MKQATAVRIFLLGLPLGLIATSAASLLWHFNQPKKPSTPQIFSVLAEEIKAEDLMGFVKNLSEIIGPRHISEPAALARTSNYIESTLNERNIGYHVAFQDYEVEGQAARNVWVEVPGGKRRNECIVVAAHYDAPQGQAGANNNASSVAALLALAENFVSEKPVLTIRFAFLTNGTPPHGGTPHSGGAQFVKLLEREGDSVRAVFYLDRIGAFPSEHPPFPEKIRSYLPSKGPFLSLLAGESSIPLLKQAAEPLSRSLSLTVHQGALGGEAASWLQPFGSSPFQAEGFPTLLIGGNGMFLASDGLPVDGVQLAQVTRSLATLVRVLSNPK